jgi:hypothetical protein
MVAQLPRGAVSFAKRVKARRQALRAPKPSMLLPRYRIPYAKSSPGKSLLLLQPGQPNEGCPGCPYIAFLSVYELRPPRQQEMGGRLRLATGWVDFGA